MFGIGKLLGDILEDHNLGGILSKLDLSSVEGLRASLDEADKEGLISNFNGLFGDISSKLNDMMGNLTESVAELFDHDADEVGAETGAAAAAAANPAAGEASNVGPIGAAAGEADLATVEVHADPQTPVDTNANWFMDREAPREAAPADIQNIAGAAAAAQEQINILEGDHHDAGVEAIKRLSVDEADDDETLIATEAELHTASPAALTQTAEAEYADND